MGSNRGAMSKNASINLDGCGGCLLRPAPRAAGSGADQIPPVDQTPVVEEAMHDEIETRT